MSLTAENIDVAIHYALEGLNSHRVWKNAINNARDCCDKCRAWADEAAKVAGDVEAHEEWIRKYTHIINILRLVNASNS